MYCIVCNKYRKLKKKIIYLKKTLSIYIFCSKCGHDYEKVFKEEESIQILKTFGLINDAEEYQKIYIHAWRKFEEFEELKNLDWKK